MPHIHRLTPDFLADTLILEWYDGGSVFQYKIDCTWQIQILRKDPMEEIALVSCLSLHLSICVCMCLCNLMVCSDRE